MSYEIKVKQFELRTEESEADAINEVTCLGYEIVSKIKNDTKLILALRRDTKNPYYSVLSDMEEALHQMEEDQNRT